MSFILLQNSSIFQIFKPTIFTSLFQVLIEYSLYEATWIGSDNFSFFEKKKTIHFITHHKVLYW